MHCLRTTLISLTLGVVVSLGAFVTVVQAAPAITRPAPGSTLTTSSVTFTGGHTDQSELHWAYVGSTSGGNDFYAGAGWQPSVYGVRLTGQRDDLRQILFSGQS